MPIVSAMSRYGSQLKCMLRAAPAITAGVHTVLNPRLAVNLAPHALHPYCRTLPPAALGSPPFLIAPPPHPFPHATASTGLGMCDGDPH